MIKPSFLFQFTLEERGNDQRADDDCAKGYSIPPEGLEIVFFNEVRQKLDRGKGYAEGYDRAYDKIPDLRGGHAPLFHEKFQQLISACAHHGRDREIESELRCRNSGNA